MIVSKVKNGHINPYRFKTLKFKQITDHELSKIKDLIENDKEAVSIDYCKSKIN